MATYRYMVTPAGHFVCVVQDGRYREAGVIRGIGATMQIGAKGKFLSKVKKVAKKVAKAKAFKALANTAMKAADASSGGAASRAMSVVKRATNAAKSASQEAERELSDLPAGESERVRAMMRPGQGSSAASPTMTQSVDDSEELDDPTDPGEPYEDDEEDY